MRICERTKAYPPLLLFAYLVIFIGKPRSVAGERTREQHSPYNRTKPMPTGRYPDPMHQFCNYKTSGIMLPQKSIDVCSTYLCRIIEAIVSASERSGAIGNGTAAPTMCCFASPSILRPHAIQLSRSVYCIVSHHIHSFRLYSLIVLTF